MVQPVQVIRAKPDHSVTLNVNLLRDILMQDKIKDRYVSIVSISGAFRNGKGFLLDFCLKYLYAKYVTHKSKDWLGSDNEILNCDGYTWRNENYKAKKTCGIKMWPELFTHDYYNGEKVAIILLDAEGFLNSRTFKDSARIFALSTMISSVQIYNLSQNISENDLQNIDLFTEYGILATKEQCKKPFQKLMILVRDWFYPYEYKYGIVGGEKLLLKRLHETTNQGSEITSFRHHSISSYMELSCCLIAHPGLIVSTNPNFNGRLKEITHDFKNCIRELIPKCFGPRHIIVKEINGRRLTGRDLFKHFISCTVEINKNNLTEPKTMILATAETNNLAAIKCATDFYINIMNKFFGDDCPYMNERSLNNFHTQLKAISLNIFSLKAIVGGKNFIKHNEGRLINNIDDLYFKFKFYNERKNVFYHLKTPAIIFVVGVIMHVLSYIFGLLRFNMVASSFHYGMLTIYVTLLVWGFLTYKNVNVEFIDTIADLIYKYVLEPLTKYMEKNKKGINPGTNDTN